MNIGSTAFADGGMIPRRYTGFGEDVSPSFIITGAPKGTVSFAIIMDDLDVPFVKRFNHWLLWNIPVTDIIPEGLPHGEVIHEPFSALQGAAWGMHRYRGPKPPFFIRNTHRYVFTLYALDRKLTIPGSSDKEALLCAMKGHILDEAQMTGRFGR